MVKNIFGKENKKVVTPLAVKEYKSTKLVFINGKRQGPEEITEEYYFDCPKCERTVMLNGRWTRGEDMSDQGRDYYKMKGHIFYCSFCGGKYASQ